jgi:quercetin 2,3-dioxygenase
MPRTVRNIHRAERDDVGTLVTRRPLPSRSIDSLDPFLFLNHHGPQTYPRGNQGLPFGPHPHRGFETVTFILEGDLLHRDSGGHESVIGAGGAQWMTAGRGLIHAELSSPGFMERGGPLEILQLWVNLPARLKMTEPRYLGVQERQVPQISLDGATVSLIAGGLLGRQGPVESLTGVWMSTVSLAPGASLRLPAPRGRAVFLYVARGALSGVPAFHLVELNDDADEVELRSTGGATALFGHAAPLGEPVVAQGPFVMNTREEIVQAVRDYHAGLFGPPMA